MSTRGIIIFVGKQAHYSEARVGYRLYQHCDSYPTFTLPLIRDAIRAANKLVKDGNADSPVSDEHNRFAITAEMLAGLYIGKSTTLYGLGAKLEKTVHMNSAPTVLEGKSRFLWDSRLTELLGEQGDLEWIYIVDTDKQNVDVFGGGYSGELPEKTLGEGTVDPLSYCDRLEEGYQEPDGKKIASAVRSLKRLGWPVNS